MTSVKTLAYAGIWSPTPPPLPSDVVVEKKVAERNPEMAEGKGNDCMLWRKWSRDGEGVQI